MKTPTTQELADQNLTYFESALAQTSPLNDKAFLRVLSVLLALVHTGLYKLAVERSRQALALTASGTDLDAIGTEYSTPRKPAEFAMLTVTLPATTDVVIPATSNFVGDSNGKFYSANTSAVSVGGVATLQITATEAGAAGNLQAGDTLTIVSQVPGASAVAMVSAVTNTGTDVESDDEYAPRVLFAERSSKGGGNSTDYKIWAEEVAGVARAYPYSGKPHRLGLVSYPGDRTVYVEADTDLDPDGVPDTGLLAEVRAALNFDPATGAARPSLGLADATLYVEPIVSSGATVEVTGFSAPEGFSATVQSAVSAALTLYFKGLTAYVAGVDLAQDRNDLITDLTVAGIVQAVLAPYGASATRVRFRLASTPFVTSYRVEPGERVKLAGVTYV